MLKQNKTFTKINKIKKNQCLQEQERMLGVENSKQEEVQMLCLYSGVYH